LGGGLPGFVDGFSSGFAALPGGGWGYGGEVQAREKVGAGEIFVSFPLR